MRKIILVAKLPGRNCLLDLLPAPVLKVFAGFSGALEGYFSGLNRVLIFSERHWISSLRTIPI